MAGGRPLTIAKRYSGSPTFSNARRSFTRLSSFIFRTSTVVRPISVFPRIKGPRRSKWSPQAVLPWIEQLDDLLSQCVDARQIRSLVRIAPFASERKIRRIVAPAMLLGADVLDLKSRKRQVTLEQAAILTPAFRSIADQLTNRFIHAQAEVLRNMARAFA